MKSRVGSLSKIVKLLAKVMKRTRRPKLIELNIKTEIATDHNGIQKPMKTSLKNLYSTKLEDLKKMDEFLSVFDIPKLNQDEIDNSNKR